ncbi:hypothetical protein [Neorhizobium sp. P12A]|uniref:hypothetical protein n=1 Tax=Neorhizobium sp. P12A TaxID=2268027 RepID=UPI0011EBCADB|nr:hypothetical protein [Neorhizobium sp. P12A]
MPVKFETWRVNVWNMAIIGISIAANAAWAGYIWNDTQRDIRQLQQRFDMEADARKDRLKNYQDSITGLQQQVAQIPPISFQVTRAIEATAENKKGIDAANDRIDRVVESFGGKLDNVIDTINKVSTQVQVLSSKLDDMQGKGADKTNFRMPVIKP